MMNDKILKGLEFDKIIDRVNKFIVLNESKKQMDRLFIADNYEDAIFEQQKTFEASKLLYDYGVGGIDYFDEIGDLLERAKKGATLSMAELLRVASLLKSSRILYSNITNIDDEEIFILKQVASNLFVDMYLENDITDKIVSEDKMSDNASTKLKDLRKLISKLNEQIRLKLSSYIRQGSSKFLQDSIITMRGDRYVIPVKSQYRSQVRGLVHDQSASGSTIFIEPEAVLEFNNQLKSALIEEQLEIERILSELSQAVGVISSNLSTNIENVVIIDMAYSKAIYAYKTKSIKPKLNNNGIIKIKGGRHPLIDPLKVIPTSIDLGEKYNYVLVTGPNTGGKTVTLKMVGLFSVMAMSGLYIPAQIAECSIFTQIFCDVGDEQSIEQSLSTFSSHMKNIINITENVDNKSLVLIDEIGAGTDPDEGSALAESIIKHLLNKGSYGIITTHYSKLKEFAYTNDKIINASMDFDSKTFAPLYRINIGMPGSSNAIEIAKMLGLSTKLTDGAVELLTDNKVSFDNVIRQAEKSRQEAEQIKLDVQKLKIQAEQEMQEINKQKQKFDNEKQKFYTEAKVESRRIVNQKLEEAEDLVEQIRIMFDKAELDSGDLIRARTIRNSLEDKKYSLEESQTEIVNYKPVDITTLKNNDKVYYKDMEAYCMVSSVNLKKKEVTVFLGSAKINVKSSQLFFVQGNIPKAQSTVSLKRQANDVPLTKINVIGQNVLEALPEVEKFLDQAVVNNLPQVEIVHGKGLKILSSNIHAMLKRHKGVESYRFGKYGEGEHGVTIVKLK